MSHTLTTFSCVNWGNREIYEWIDGKMIDSPMEKQKQLKSGTSEGQNLIVIIMYGTM